MTPSPRESTRLRPLGSLWIAALSAAIPSCGGASEGVVPLHPASGRVLRQGKPLPDVQLVFRPAGLDQSAPSPVPIGRSDPDGKFRLRTAVGEAGQLSDGAPAGDYLVGITTARPSDSIDLFRKDAPKVAPDLVQGRYADPKTSGLKATIKPGANALEPFDLR